MTPLSTETSYLARFSHCASLVYDLSGNPPQSPALLEKIQVCKPVNKPPSSSRDSHLKKLVTQDDRLVWRERLNSPLAG